MKEDSQDFGKKDINHPVHKCISLQQDNSFLEYIPNLVGKKQKFLIFPLIDYRMVHLLQKIEAREMFSVSLHESIAYYPLDLNIQLIPSLFFLKRHTERERERERERENNDENIISLEK